MRRRTFVQGAGLAVAALVIGLRRGHAEPSAAIVWNVPRNQVPAIRETLDFNGTVTPDNHSTGNTRGLPLLFIFAGIVSLSSLANALAAVYRDLRYGGVVVSARDGRLEINNDPRLSGGTMIVYGDGVEVFHATPEREVDPSELLKSLTAITTRRLAR